MRLIARHKASVFIMLYAQPHQLSCCCRCHKPSVFKCLNLMVLFVAHEFAHAMRLTCKIALHYKVYHFTKI